VQVWVPLIAWPATAQVVPEPLGVVLIFSCWNFPLGMIENTNYQFIMSTSFPCIFYSYGAKLAKLNIRDANVAIAIEIDVTTVFP
jgi:hypothetical protein